MPHGGGGDQLYHVPDLNELIHTVDYISVHTYPMHDTHYNPQFWGVTEEERKLPKKVQIDTAMRRSLAYAQNQYNSVVSYMESLGVNKPIHIGETGWASTDNHLYGAEGSKATDEYKQDIYHQLMRDWTNEAGISCFYFEAFDEPWKDANNKGGSENHFGLFTVDGQAKYAIWELVDQGIFDGLTRNGNLIKKTHGGDFEVVFANSPLPTCFAISRKCNAMSKLTTIAIVVMIAFAACTSKQNTMEITVYETSAAGKKLEEVKQFNVVDDPTVITIDTSKTLQSITGFGGSFTESSAYLLNQLSAENRERILQAYFGKEGARYSLTRTHMNSCDFSLSQYSYAPVAGDTDLKHFSIEEDREDIIPMIKDAMRISEDGFKIISSPWTAPPWMKDNRELGRR